MLWPKPCPKINPGFFEWEPEYNNFGTNFGACFGCIFGATFGACFGCIRMIGSKLGTPGP